jgi:DNA-binding CsgD family transcriptional regulator
MTLTATTEQQVFQSVKRVCYAGLDSVTLRLELARRVARVVPSDENHFWTLDPDTGLISHGVAENPSPGLVADFVGHYYPDDEAGAVIDQARAGAILKRGVSGALAEMAGRYGIRYDMRALFFTPEACWGSWCILRGPGPTFSAREERFMERIAPHVAEGLKSAALMDLAMDRGEADDAEPRAEPAAAVPGFLVLGPEGGIALRSPAASSYLEDLGMDAPAVLLDDAERLPFAMLSVRGRLARMHRLGLADDAPAAARIRARGRSGGWYTLVATQSEPDASGRSSTMISIEPAASREIAPLLFRLYGLSPREREVLVWVVKGEPTKRIAHHLGLSVYTVQDYLDKACDKVGVRGRKELVAKLFRDGFTPGVVA